MKQVPGSVYDRSGANRPGPQPGLHHQHMTANNNNNGMPSYVPRMASGAAGAGVAGASLAVLHALAPGVMRP